MTLSEALGKFLDDKKANGLQQNSIKNYNTTLSFFIDFIGSNTLVPMLTYETVADYLTTLHNGHLSRNTIVSYIRNIKIFLKWVDGYERLSFGVSRIKKLKSEKKVLPIYNSMQWKMIKEACTTYIPWITLRNIAIVSVLADCGIRRKEVAQLQKSDFYSEHGKLHVIVHGKGLKDRPVTIGKEAFAKISAYLEACPFKDSQALFVTKTGNPISTNTVSQFCTDVKLKLPFPFSPHILRHNYCTLVCEQYIRKHGFPDYETLRILLGHESIDTTKKYVHLAMERIASQNAISLLDENLFSVADAGTENLSIFDNSVLKFSAVS